MSWILDAEPEIFLHIRFWGLMPQKWVSIANETAKLSEYKTATFLEGGEHMISQMEENSFDGTESRY